MEPLAMHVTMVKKRLAGGEPCRKCIQAEDLLRARGAWGRIDQVLWADASDAGSEGMRLAGHYGIDSAPFFIVREADGAAVAYESVLKLLRERFETLPLAHAAVPEPTVIDGLALELATRSPIEIVRWGLERFGSDCALAFSGAEDVALIDMAARTGRQFSVFCLDTGRLHAETYRFIDRVRKHYGIEIALISPDPRDLEPFVRQKGLFSFYEDGHQQCCTVRKVAPLRRALGGYRAWMTGQRRDQSPTRAHVPTLQLDGSFTGRDGVLLKLNPLAALSLAETWSYIREHDVPYNPLHERGFASIGCEPCTRPTHPGQHEREGRWWWEEATQKECGLHSVAPPKP